MDKSTSWGSVAGWYDSLLEGKDTFQEMVILPNILRLMAVKPGERVLDIACGQGMFSRAYHRAGAIVTGTDIASELIAIARQKSSPEITFLTAPAETMEPIASESHSQATIILALQNMAEPRKALRESARILSKNGTLHIVLNHPAFRIPKASEWGFDAEKNIQFRRVDRYLSEYKADIAMHPGSNPSTTTPSFHRPLQWYAKMLRAEGFAIAGMEEWISHRQSDSGPRADSENRARKEFPLFLYIQAIKFTQQ